MTPIENFLAFYQELSLSNLDELKAIYSDDVVFIDPVAKHTGLPAVEAYFIRLLRNCTGCHFDIRSTNEDENRAYVDWCMTFEHPKLKRGKPIPVDGFSVLDLEGGKVIRQRDYYDMGAMVYEHVPLLGGFVSGLRRRMAA